MAVRAGIGVSAAGLLVFMALVAAQGWVLVPGFDPGRQQVSEFIHSPAHGALVTGLCCWSLSLAALAAVVLGVERDRGPSRLLYLQAAALLAAAVAIVLLATFPTDRGLVAPGVVSSSTLSGDIHDLSSAAATGCILTAVSAGIARRGGWIRAFTAALLAVAVTSSIALMAFGDPLPGVRQRALLAAACLWQVAWLYELRSEAATTSV